MLLGSLAFTGATRSAHAALIASESFVYAASASIDGQSGGIGWTGAWVTGQTAAFTAVGAINGAPSIGQSGGAMSVSASGRIFRKLDLSPGSAAAAAGLVKTHSAMYFGQIDGVGAPGTTLWVGLLVSGGGPNSGQETQYHLYDGARTDAASLGLGDQNKDGEAVAMLRGGNVPNWGFERTCTHSTCASGSGDGYWATKPPVLFGGTHWSVTRFVFKASATEITMWVDPPVGAQPPADGSAAALTPYSGNTAATTTSVPAMFFDTFTPNAGGAYGYVVDEIRIGTAFADLSNGGNAGGGGGGGGAGTGGTSTGGSAGVGGTSAGGTSAGGTSPGGTSAGGTSAGGTSAGSVSGGNAAGGASLAGASGAPHDPSGCATTAGTASGGAPSTTGGSTSGVQAAGTQGEAGDAATSSATDDSAGCACTVPRGDSSTAASPLWLLAALIGWRRRRALTTLLRCLTRA